MAKTFIVKVQRDFTGNEVLIYDKPRVFFYQGPMLEDLKALLPNTPDKAYAMAKMNGTDLEILHTVKAQNW